MSIVNFFNRSILRRLLVNKVRNLTWEQVVNGGYSAGVKFGEVVAGVSELSASVKGPEDKDLRQITVNLAGINFSVAAKVEAIRNNRPVPPLRSGTQLELEATTFAQAKSWHEQSIRALVDAGHVPELSSKTSEHEQFGPLTAKEWIAVTTYYHELALLQVDRLMKSPQYAQSLGRNW